MIDDIVTRLRKHYCQNIYCCEVPDEAADEIERLREIIKDISDAVTDEGRKPAYHRQQANYVRTMWNPLWQAIGKAVKEASRD